MLIDYYIMYSEECIRGKISSNYDCGYCGLSTENIFELIDLSVGELEPFTLLIYHLKKKSRNTKKSTRHYSFLFYDDRH